LRRDPHHGVRPFAQYMADEPRHRAAFAHRVPAPRAIWAFRMAVILNARDLCKSFGAVSAAAEVNAAIERDSVVGLIGTNGAGKTTFINMITGYMKPDRGSIEFEGRDITPLEPREITRLGICRSFQIPQLYGSLSVFDNMMVALGVVLANAGRGGFFSRGEPLVPGFEAP